MKLVKTLLVCLSLSFVVSGAMATSGMASEDAPRLVVSGLGSVDVAPDMAVISIGAEVQNQSARTAMADVGDRLQAMLQRLSVLGVDEADVQTQHIFVRRIDEYDSRGKLILGERAVFEASSALSVRLRDLDRLGDVLDGLMEDGGNMLRGFRLTVQDSAPHVDEARRRAVVEAKRKAQLYADAAGVELGRLIELRESGAGHRPEPVMAEMTMARSGSMPVARGEVTFNASVSMVFALPE